MRIFYVLVLTTISFSLATDWKCSIKCGHYGYEKCMAEKANHTDGRQNHAETLFKQQQKGAHVRGRGGMSRRQLKTPDFDFQIKMYWKEGFCVRPEYLCHYV